MFVKHKPTVWGFLQKEPVLLTEVSPVNLRREIPYLGSAKRRAHLES